jgi:hypothetical protein
MGPCVPQHYTPACIEQMRCCLFATLAQSQNKLLKLVARDNLGSMRSVVDPSFLFCNENESVFTYFLDV